MCLELVDTLTVSDQHAIISSGTFSHNPNGSKNLPSRTAVDLAVDLANG
jgi:hypothetical protein